ncbi:DUF5919 domain-containing protein [Sphaerisporangium sp. NPDC049002]|uniref:DUF5919 domain-containing protein n=1 Tax=Sphaerisporangium sp. NPDC049002 TaxID=3155392 RepID=UPI0033E0528B
MTDQSILLKTLLRQRHWQTYAVFCREYDKAAKKIDPERNLARPSRAQLHRWLAGELKSLPYADHCRVLEAMFPGYSAEELFRVQGAEALANGIGHSPPIPTIPAPRPAPVEVIGNQLADVSAIFSSRAEFASAYPPPALFDHATDIAAAGLSLNLICQSYPDHQLKRLLEGGTRIRCLFLDPQGEAIKAREREEGQTPNTLVHLTALNINVLSRLKSQLAPEVAKRFELAVYDETIRYNILIVDQMTCVVQPYLPQARGLDSPTLVIRDNGTAGGLFPVFDQVFTSLWERSRAV